MIKSLLKKIAKTDPKDETYMAKITVLKEIVEHHVEEEEKEYFPKLRNALGEEELLGLGQKMQTMFDKLIISGQTKH